MDGGGGGNRAEAERWLYTANKLLSARDLHGARSFAIRARESDPTYEASEHLLTVIDTLLAGESRINDHHRDWYGILQILRYTTNIDHIAAQYRRLALLLDPHRNLFAFASHAFSLVHDAWSVLSNPAKKAMYDSELRLLTTPPPPQPPPHPPPPQPHPHPAPRRNPRSRDDSDRPESAESTRQTRTVETDGGTSFWTSCPYCYVLYEYPKVYEECTLRCQSCRRGFHAVVIRSPPPLTGKDGSYCSWGFFPLGFSGDSKDVNGFASNWNPFSPLFPCPLKGSSNRKTQRNWAYYDDEAAAAFIEFSDPSDDDSGDGDWRGGKRSGRKRTRVHRRKSSGDVRREPVERPRRGVNAGHDENEGSGDAAGAVNANASAGTNAASSAAPSGARAESSKKAALGGSRRRGAANLGKLDLNVEFSNEVEEPSRGARDREGNAAGHAEDNIEGIGFFEGLDEFLSSLPILNVVADDKVKGH
ncbi:DnaJ subfamily B member 12 [Spatholobus suberectus]|nr:DnaJ subfamily B member 12 [Spatholobus suberectus]